MTAAAGSGTSSGSGGGTRKFSPTETQKQQLSDMHQRLTGLDQINKRMVELKQELAITPFSNMEKREKLEKEINELQKDYKKEYQAAINRAKQIADVGNDLMGQMMSVLAANLTLYRKNARRGALDYLNPFSDPRKTWQIRKQQQEIDKEESKKRQEERANTPVGMAISGVGKVVGVVGAGANLTREAFKYGGQLLDQAGNSAMDTGSEMRSKAWNGGGDDSNFSRASRGAQFVVGAAASAVAAIPYAFGLGSKILAAAAGVAAGVGSGVEATSEYLNGRREHLVAENYTDVLRNLAEGFDRLVDEHTERAAPLNHDELDAENAQQSYRSQDVGG